MSCAVCAELLVGLHVDAIRAIIEVEIVHVGRAHVDAQRVGDLRERDVQALGFFAIDGHQILRIIGGKGGEQSASGLCAARLAAISSCVTWPVPRSVCAA